MVAMQAEAQPMIDHFQLLPEDSLFATQNLPFRAYQGTYNDHKITLVTNGTDTIYQTGVDNCGTVPAGLAAYLALQATNDEVDVLINAGTCGGFARMGAAIGDVYVVTAVAHHDRRIPIPGGFEQYGIGRVDTCVRLNPAKNMAKDLNFKVGVCTTGNSLDATDADHVLMLANEASVKDMEAAAIVWSCELHNKPFIGIKVVTDIVDGSVATQDEFMQNLQAASESLQSAMPKVLEYICGKAHHEL
jgi:5'-methylthioadenosine nucleosidase